MKPSMHNDIHRVLQASLEVHQAMLADEALQGRIAQVAEAMVATFRQGGKVLLCGNGGSAADAQHIAAELSGRFYLDRQPLFAEALHVNTSYLTSVANDYAYDEVYARATRGMGRAGDILIGISTSGNSTNVLRAMQAAREIGMRTVAMTGSGGGKMKDNSEHLLNVPSTDTPRIQEGHILIGHLLCELVEKEFFAS